MAKKIKLKTKKAAAKRFKITATGKVLRYGAGMRHLMEHKKPGRKRQKRGALGVSMSDMEKIRLMLPGH